MNQKALRDKARRDDLLPLALHRLAEYNAGMGPNPAAEVDAWLRAGGVVVAASDRAARAVAAAFHRARRREGLTAWPAPNILDWKTFARAAWEERTTHYRQILNSIQEQSLWAATAAESGQTAEWFEGTRRRLADLAMEAHDLLCAYAFRFLRASARSAWQQDAGAFSGWLAAFDEICRSGDLLSASRVPLEVVPLLESEQTQRPPLLLAGFDRLLPVQRDLFNAWGEWRQMALGAPASDVLSFAAADTQMELSACALWCSRQLSIDPQARLLVITQDASQRRGEIERTFLKHVRAASPPCFEFSLGVPLSQVRLARAAYMLLRWLDSTLEENELDWLLATGMASVNQDEAPALQAYMRALRRRGMQRTRWTLEAFLRQPAAFADLPPAWVHRMKITQDRLMTANRPPRSPLEWAGLVPQLLEAMGWPGLRPLSSAEFQAAQRWQQAVDLCGSLGFDGRCISWIDFLTQLSRTLDETLFAPESHDAPILIAGPAESAGLNADAIWFLGVDEDVWPARGSAHPLLPLGVQREADMPHASPQLDWNLAASITERILASAPTIRFSYARQKESVEMRPSRLVAQLAKVSQSLPVELVDEMPVIPLTAAFEDTTRIVFAPAPVTRPSPQLSLFDDQGAARGAHIPLEVKGGSNVLTSQSQCAFKAFATSRLGAKGWEPAEAGLTASQRGQLLHSVLHAVWGATPPGIRTLEQLRRVADLRSFVEDHVHRVLAEEMPVCAREQMPKRYLELEEHRLTRLVTEWLEYERTRLPFAVEETEVDAATTISGLTLKLRLDRVDRLNDGSLLVVDYKTGSVSTNSWELPRPDDVQLPLYGEFGIAKGNELGGLVFAKIRHGDECFTGHLRDARSTLFDFLDGKSGLVKKPLTDGQLNEWRDAIGQLARDFLAGRADVDPRDYPKTCDRCGLYTLCRVREREDEMEMEEETNGVEIADE